MAPTAAADGVLNPDAAVPKAVSYILFDWLRTHMEFHCYADAVTATATDVDAATALPQLRRSPYCRKPKVLCHLQLLPPPVHFWSADHVIEGRHYSLELHKDPSAYWMKELTVLWLPHLDAETPPEFFATIRTNNVVPHPSGFYRVVSEFSDDYEFLVRLQITRV